jgi:hypothetical protein
MDLDTPGLDEFLTRQCRDFGGNVEVDTGLWALVGIPGGDAAAEALARGLLAQAPFAHEEGLSEDDAWRIFYVGPAQRLDAMHWLEDWRRRVAGEVREPTPAQQAAVHDLVESPTPHRVAQGLADEHAAGRLPAGSVREARTVRALLDRLHGREPLFYAALQQLLEHHLIDLIVLLQQAIAEDIELTNEAVLGGLSRDPFLQTRQNAAVEIRRRLVEYHVINSLDQQKNTAIANPYAAAMDVMQHGAELTLALDGKSVTVSAARFVQSIRSIRRNLYNGGQLEQFDTQAPWMRAEIALPFRFVKRQVELHRGLAPLDGLFMLERAVTL